MTDVGDRIRQLREAAGWSHDDLASAAELTLSRVRGFDDGSTVPTMHECFVLESVLPGCSPQELGIRLYGDTYRGTPGFDATATEKGD